MVRGLPLREYAQGFERGVMATAQGLRALLLCAMKQKIGHPWAAYSLYSWRRGEVESCPETRMDSGFQ